MCRIFICGLSGPAVFFRISHIGLFSKKNFEHKLFFDFLYNFYLQHSLYKKNRARYYQKYILLSCNVPSFLSDFNKTWIVSTHFRKVPKY
jgi:hypothetical protein